MGNGFFTNNLTKTSEPENILTDKFITTRLSTLDNNKSFCIHTCWATNSKWKSKLHSELQNRFTNLVGKDDADCIIALAESDGSRVEPCCNYIIDNLRQDDKQLEKTVIILCHKDGADSQRYTNKRVSKIWHIDYGKHESVNETNIKPTEPENMITGTFKKSATAKPLERQSLCGPSPNQEETALAHGRIKRIQEINKIAKLVGPVMQDLEPDKGGCVCLDIEGLLRYMILSVKSVANEIKNPIRKVQTYFPRCLVAGYLLNVSSTIGETYVFNAKWYFNPTKPSITKFEFQQYMVSDGRNIELVRNFQFCVARKDWSFYPPPTYVNEIIAHLESIEKSFEIRQLTAMNKYTQLDKFSSNGEELWVLFQTTQNCNKKGKSNEYSPENHMPYFLLAVSLGKLDVELRTVVRYLRGKHSNTKCGNMINKLMKIDNVSARNQFEGKCADSTEMREKKTLLTQILFEKVTDTLPMAETHFFESPEKAMRVNGENHGAELCQNIPKFEDMTGTLTSDRLTFVVELSINDKRCKGVVTSQNVCPSTGRMCIVQCSYCTSEKNVDTLIDGAEQDNQTASTSTDADVNTQVELSLNH